MHIILGEILMQIKSFLKIWYLSFNFEKLTHINLHIDV